ncbi:MAG TPA: M56 family metallopeptidase [Bryobacteraceae bacterium]|jgi:TonB family protein|nr:M56 family metallopeptidase [Bryobacteraceae bacterium]
MNWYEWNGISLELLRSLAGASVRAVVLAGMAGLVALFLRRNAAAQHALWTLVMAGMLLLPLLHPAVPAPYVYVLHRSASAAAAIFTDASPAAVVDSIGGPSVSPRIARPTPAPAWPLYLGIAYIAGVAALGSQLAWGLWMTRRLRLGARSIAPDLWRHFDLVADAGTDTRIEESDSVRVPITAGFKHVRVLFPVEWRGWTAEKIRLVLAHELAHARRRDPLIGLVAAINRCLFWFHPLAWWLERRVAVLAEHAADDAALAVAGNAQNYARVLLEVASGMAGFPRRVIWNASAINGQLVSRRIRRIMDLRTLPSGRLGKLACTTLLPVAAAMIWISLAVDLQSVARAQATTPAADAGAAWFGFRSDGIRPDLTSAEEAAQMEQQLAVNPEDEAARSKLLHYYWAHEMHEQRVSLVLWLIDHHPESALHGYQSASIFPSEGKAADFIAFGVARSRWLAQVNLHPDDARVLANAARALGEGSTAEGMDLLERARQLDPAHETGPLAMLYAMLLEFNCDLGAYGGRLHDPALDARVRSTLQESSDPALVGAVARQFVNDATMKALTGADHWDMAALRATATELVTHAQALEPPNREWSDLMEGVKGLGNAPAGMPAGPGVVHIGTGVAAGMLLRSSPPVYPPLAKMARIQGVVKLQVRIGTDGTVKETTVISGHPLLVPAAVNAVKSYVYKPVTLAGKAVEAVATVEVAFDPGRE